MNKTYEELQNRFEYLDGLAYDIKEVVKYLCEKIDQLKEEKKDKNAADLQNEMINKKVLFDN